MGVPVFVLKLSSDSPCLVVFTQSKYMSVICSSLIDEQSYPSPCRPVRGSENFSSFKLLGHADWRTLASRLVRYCRRRLWYSRRCSSLIKVSGCARIEVVI